MPETNLDKNFTTFRGPIVSIGEDGFAIRTPLGLKLYRPWENDWTFADPFTEYLYLGGWFQELSAEIADDSYIGLWAQFSTSEAEQHDALTATGRGDLPDYGKEG